MFLLQNAVGAIELNLGPFVDAADGHTPETELSIVQADIRIGKADGTIAQTGNAFGGEHSENGYYYCKINGADCDQVGLLRVMVSMAGARPVVQDFFVLPPGVYHALTGTGLINASSVLTAEGLASAPTGSTIVYNLGGVVAIGDITPLPLVAQRYSAFSLPVPVSTNQAGKTHRFTVVSQKNKATVLFTLDYTHCTPGTAADGSYIVTVADSDQYTDDLVDGYWYLQNLTDDLRVGEGIWTVEDGPNFGS